MKTAKWFAAVGLTVLSVGALAACGNAKSASNTTYSYVYSSDPDTLDYLLSNRAATSDITSNVIDGLLESDKYGNLVPSLAEDWTVSKDGLTYTYKLRKDAKWYTADGEEYAKVKAQDFVTGIKHAVEKKSEALYLVQNSIKGLDAYVKGETKDFSTVGVKAVDDYTVEYTLSQPESFWNSKTTMGILFPVNEEFLKSQGDKFGTTGKISTLLYNGPFVLKNMTAKSVIEMAKNQNYWDKKNVSLETIKLSYYDGQDQDSLIRNFTEGAYTVATLFPNSSNYASAEKKYKNDINYSPQDGTTYYYNFNFNRIAYSHTSKTADAQKEATKKAVLNKDFRQALNFAFDRTSFAAQTNGKDGASKILRNSLVPPTFVQIGDKDFGTVVDEKIAALGDEWSGLNTADAQDGLYNPTKAKAEFAKAKEALQVEGVQFPIHLDVPVDQTDTNLVQQVSSLKQSVESALGTDNVVLDLQQMSPDDYDSSTYYAQTAAQKDYDFSMSGWSPDYQDPSTYLDIFDPDKGGMLQNIGLEAGQNKDIVSQLGLDEYQKLLNDANNETLDVTKRYEKYAAAQAWLTDSSITLPAISRGGRPTVQRTVPFTRANALVGTKGDSTNYKLLQVQNEILTSKEYKAAYKKYQEEKAKSNAKAQEELAKHVK